MDLLGLLWWVAILLGSIRRNSSFWSSENRAPRLIRGRNLLMEDEAQRRSRQIVGEGQSFPLGGVDQPWSALTSHVLVLGTTGSGKTNTIRVVIGSVLPGIKPGSDRRAFIYDGKLDMLGYIFGMDVTCPVHLLNPLDIRCSAWDVAADCTTLATAQQIGAVFIPEEDGPNRYFSDAGRDLFVGIIEAFLLHCPGLWTLRDLLLAANSAEMMEHILSLHPVTRARVGYFKEQRTFSSIHTTLTSRLAPFGIVAACWDRARDKVSLNEWARSESILVLGSDETTRFAMDAIVRVVYQRKSEIALGQTESNSRLSLDVLDEVRDAGKLVGLSRVLTKGRSKGCAVILGMQDIDGFASVHGEKVANEILGQCSTKAILRLENERIAEWASKLLGDQEWNELHKSKTKSGGTKSETSHWQRITRRVVLAGELLSIPPTDLVNGLTGYYLSPFIGAFKSTMDAWRLDAQLTPRSNETPNFLPRPSHHQILRPWDEQDKRRLNLNGYSL